MIEVSRDFETQCRATGQEIVSCLEVSWDDLGVPSDPRGDANWIDETAYLITDSGRISISPPGESLIPAGDIGQMDITLDNSTQRFSYRNASSPLVGYIDGDSGLIGKPIRLWRGFRFIDPISGNPTSEYVALFTGVIADWQESTDEGVVTLTCADWGWRIVQDKMSTALATNLLPNEWTQQIAAAVGITNTVLDVGIFRIPHLWMDDESAWEEIAAVWEADGGLAYFDAYGALHGENSLHWASAEYGSVMWTFRENEYRMVNNRIVGDALATKIVCEWSGRVVAPQVSLYELDRPKNIMPLRTESWTARYSQASTGAITLDPDDPYNDYYAQSMGGANLTSSISVSITNSYAQQCTVNVTNNSATHAAMLTFMRIRGYPLQGGPTEQTEASVASPAVSYERTRSIRGNPYIQIKSQATALVEMEAVRARKIHANFAVEGVMAVPQLELGDVVELQDLRAFGTGNTNVKCLVTGISWECSHDGGYTQRLSLWDIEGLSEYDDYFVIGTDMLGVYKRCYY